MKNAVFALVLLYFSQSPMPAQNSLAGVFQQKTKLTFLGVDFTHAKFVGADGFLDPNIIKNQHIKSWNSLLVLEPKKYSLQEPFKITDPNHYETYIDDIVMENQKTDVESNITDQPHELSEPTIRRIASNYKLAKEEGVGVVYIAENLNKTAEEFSAWVTFLDLSNNTVLHAERLVSKPRGFGVRNYWAGAIYRINKAIESKYYKNWTKQFQ